MTEIKQDTFSMKEVKAFIEEMIELDLVTDLEERVYEDLRWTGKCSRRD